MNTVPMLYYTILIFTKEKNFCLLWKQLAKIFKTNLIKFGTEYLEQTSYLMQKRRSKLKQTGGSTKWSLHKLEYHQTRVSTNLSINKLEYQLTGVSTNWSINKLEYQQTGLSRNWSINKLENQQTGVSTNWGINNQKYQQTGASTNWSINKRVIHLLVLCLS